MNMTMQKAWNSYRSQVLPADAPAVQVTECRRAFYAGAQSLMALMDNNLSSGSEITEADIGFMIAVNAELKQFCEDVKAGAA